MYSAAPLQAQLSIMQSRAEAELSLAKHQLLEKDAQLRTAEAAMGGLEKVRLRWQRPAIAEDLPLHLTCSSLHCSPLSTHFRAL